MFAGDKFPVGAVVASGDGYEVNPNIIAKVVTKLPPYMSAFEVGTSFFNPRSLTENHYLTFGHNSLEYLYAHPFVREVGDVVGLISLYAVDGGNLQCSDTVTGILFHVPAKVFLIDSTSQPPPACARRCSVLCVDGGELRIDN